MIAKVIVDLSLDRGFDYLVPPELEKTLAPGMRVKVPFGRSVRSGYLLELADAPASGDFQLRSLLGPAPGEGRLTPGLLQLGNWMADYYCCTREQAVRTLLPGAVRRGRIRQKTLKLYRIPDLAQAERFITANAENKTAAKRVAILKRLLLDREQTADTLAEAGASPSVLKTLLRDGLLEVGESEVYRDLFAAKQVVSDRPRIPTDEQQTALALIRSMQDDPAPDPHVCLLFGVTGSGKTEVYLQAIAHTLEQGKGAIVLVPEISLTPQTVRRFRARFGDALSVLHSRLTETERFDQWLKISRGEVKLVVGARSALFAPMENLGLIVVDEEHEPSYKQSEAPRYSARDVAVMRGKIERAVVLLGSATPSMESYYNAMQGRYRLATLRKRAEEQPLPAVRIVDLHQAFPEFPDHAPAPGEADAGIPPEAPKSMLFSPDLIRAVRERLALHEQVILFLNRRGFARELRCPAPGCGWVATCPECSVSYIYHRARQTLSCYLCGNVVPVPETCPQCGSAELRKKGTGTEKVEDVAQALFPRARILRMDSDTMRSAEAYELSLDRFRRGEVDILIGTQMIAKGLDFPNVTLVGILNADTGLNVPDVRAPERTFQLLTQVAGRAGRGTKSGEVIVQTYSPYNDVIRYAADQDYPGFYAYDVAVREMLKHPPFGHLIAVYFRSEDECAAAEAAKRVFQAVKPLFHEGVVANPPEPAPLARIKGKYRFLFTVRGTRLRSIRLALRELILHHPVKNVEAAIDVDAVSLS